jgi:hypothetical protein
VASLVIYLLKEQKEESQSAFSGIHSKRISNLSVAVAFTVESMSSQLSGVLLVKEGITWKPSSITLKETNKRRGSAGKP